MLCVPIGTLSQCQLPPPPARVKTTKGFSHVEGAKTNVLERQGRTIPAAPKSRGFEVNQNQDGSYIINYAGMGM